jgi:ribosomal protein L37E
MTIREGRWDCARCGTRGLLGRDTECSGCGGARPKDVRFYLPEEEAAVSDAARQAQAEAGADWICEHCGSSTRATRAECQQCGAGRGSSAAQQVRDYGMDEVPRDGSASSRSAAAAAGRAAAAAPTARQQARPRSIGRLVGGAMLVVLCLVLVSQWRSKPFEVDGQVAKTSWERAIEFEEYRTLVESDWTVPPGGRMLTSSQEVRRHDKVRDGYTTEQRTRRVKAGTEEYVCGQTDMGNGYFQDKLCTRDVYETESYTERVPRYREVPVYDTKYSYEIERWVEGRIARSSGMNDPPSWAEAAPSGARERERGRSERYIVHFLDHRGQAFDKTLSEPEWSAFTAGSDVRLRVNRRGQLLEVLAP